MYLDKFQIKQTELHMSDLHVISIGFGINQ